MLSSTHRLSLKNWSKKYFPLKKKIENANQTNTRYSITYIGRYLKCFLIKDLLVCDTIVPLQIFSIVMIEHRTAQRAQIGVRTQIG